MKKIIFLLLIGCAQVVLASDEGKLNQNPSEKSQDYRVIQTYPLAKDFLNPSKVNKSDRYAVVKNLVNGLTRSEKETLFSNLKIDLTKPNGCWVEQCEGCKKELPFDKSAGTLGAHYEPNPAEVAYTKFKEMAARVHAGFR